MASFLRSKWAPLVGLIAINLLVGLFVFTDYGESWDENSIFIYAANTAKAYGTLFGEGEMHPSLYGPFNLRFYGPFFFVLARGIATVGHDIFPRINELDFWHLAYFLSFQLALTGLYALCVRWVSRWAALGATLLFNTQPLLWGHAFINPKDIPFLAFFLISVVCGLWAVDKITSGENPSIPKTSNSFRRTFASSEKRWFILAAWVALSLSLFVFLSPP
ncbi:MAG: hypothetical protein M1347_08030 [Chloroflexi bacterium]|nr:hypothetical protein [Chloroflexota bacterium]